MITSTPEVTALVAELRTDLRSRWRRGECVPVEDYLRQHPTLAEHPSALLDLVYAEVVARDERSEQPTPDEYARRFPQLEQAIRCQFMIHEAMKPSGQTRATDPHWSGGALPHLPLPTVPGYQILQELAHGGMGVVYKAVQLGLNRVVALKMILPAAHSSASALARFRAEAEAVARLRHPGVVQVHAFGEHLGQPYFAMEYLEGGNLAERLGGQPLPEGEAAELVRQLAEAVHAAHARDVIHRDLKPANVLLTAEGQPRVSDFGLAKLLDEEDGQTQTGSVMGTPPYMAPEQARGETRLVGPRTDVYALGAILYQCLTGQPPFTGTRSEVLAQVQTREPVPPTKCRPGGSRDLEAVCLKCLEKDPARRYPSALALADDLGRWLRGESTKARPVGRARRAWRWLRHRPVVVAGLLLALLVPPVAAVVLASLRPPPPAPHLPHPGVLPDDRLGRESPLPPLPAPGVPLRQIESDLAAGRSVTLIGETGDPVWSEWAAGAAQATRAGDDTFAVRSWTFSLLELLRDPRCRRYRIRAQVRHEQSDTFGTSEVGIYVGRRGFPGPQGPAHSLIALTYNDIRDEIAVARDVRARLPKDKPLPPLPSGNKVHLCPHLCFDGPRGVGWDSRLGGLSPQLFQAAGFVGGPWRRLVVEVTPDGVSAVWGKDQEVGTLEAERVKRNIEEVLRHRRQDQPGDSSAAVIDPNFDPQGGLGLLVVKGAASFRSVVIEPLE